MPISQARILSLLSEFNTAINAYERMRETLSEVISQSRQGLPPSDALSILDAFLLTSPPPTVTCLRLEQRHFQVNARRNTTRKEKLRAQRGLQVDTSPQSLLKPEPELESSLTELFTQWNTGKPPQP